MPSTTKQPLSTRQSMSYPCSIAMEEEETVCGWPTHRSKFGCTHRTPNAQTSRKRVLTLTFLLIMLAITVILLVFLGEGSLGEGLGKVNGLLRRADRMDTPTTGSGGIHTGTIVAIIIVLVIVTIASVAASIFFCGPQAQEFAFLPCYACVFCTSCLACC
ncbi:hypothetical protein M422DRAFT_30929 [Sphaerobolus stellatus SS14]|uniref:Uncharacterized protein n=1 Tax=Sphaerobolus stellatus (strain SS14) TaxID=990650 RepID=A0A0C9V850_SPHS4|nr:hypothetical protein M422DRAFT_30929 [Sphaerobolus stellatus SS14]